MNDKPKYNPEKHHRRSMRLQGYDYSQAGLYFITICTHNRECLFGDIANGEMIWNDMGKIANEYWLEIPNHFPNAVLHEHIVMPNHTHGIIELTDSVGASHVGTRHGVSLHITKLFNRFRRIVPENLFSAEERFIGHVAGNGGVVAENCILHHRLA